MRYARGNEAWGECDRCSVRRPLKRLYYEYTDGRRNGLRVCSDCLDEENPQTFIDEVDLTEAIAIRDPRPPKNVAQSRSFYGFDPVAPNIPLRLTDGRVTVTVT